MKAGKFQTVVAFMVRVPEAGRVKTRLIHALDAAGACRLYRAMVEDILWQLARCGLPVWLVYDGETALLPQAWQRAAAGIEPQRGTDIGERMAAALQRCFAVAERVVLIGSDIPALDASIITRAAAALDTHDLAITPVADGGYCLLAMHRHGYRAELFVGIPWSTGKVLQATLDRCAASDLRVCLLETLRDIDTPADLDAYRAAPCASARATNRELGINPARHVGA